MLPETITKLETAKRGTIKPETAKLEVRKEIRKNLMRYLTRCSIGHLQCVYIYGNILCAVDSCLSEKDIEEQLSL